MQDEKDELEEQEIAVKRVEDGVKAARMAAGAIWRIIWIIIIVLVVAGICYCVGWLWAWLKSDVRTVESWWSYMWSWL
jgi:flagellar basal body-associated protein FliL